MKRVFSADRCVVTKRKSAEAVRFVTAKLDAASSAQSTKSFRLP